jgi:hypothetical protein
MTSTSLQTTSVAGTFLSAKAAKFHFKYLIQFETVFPLHQAIGGMLHAKCGFRGPDHLCFTANPPQLQAHSNQQNGHNFASNIWFNFFCSPQGNWELLLPTYNFRGIGHLHFTANSPWSLAHSN